MDVKAEATGFSVEECSRLRAQQVQEPGGGQTWWLSGRNCHVIPAPEGGVAPEDREVPNHHRLREISLDFILKGMEGLLGVVQWLRPCVSTTGGIGLIRGQGTKIPYVEWPKEKTKKKEVKSYLKFLTRGQLFLIPFLKDNSGCSRARSYM